MVSFLEVIPRHREETAREVFEHRRSWRLMTWEKDTENNDKGKTELSQLKSDLSYIEKQRMEFNHQIRTTRYRGRWLNKEEETL